MDNFKFGNRSRDRRDSSRENFGDRDSRRPLLHDAVCDECGKDCRVPFKPSGEKPVYCSDCFEKKGGRDSNRARGREDYSRRSFGGRDSRRPSQSNISDRGISQLTEKIGVLNTKLDTIINLLHRLQGEKVEFSTMSRRSDEVGVAQPRKKKPPASAPGEASLSSAGKKKSDSVKSRTEKNKKPKTQK